MLAAFGFFRFSCALLIRCFVKSKRRRRSDRHASDSEDDEPSSKTKTRNTAKLAIARVIRIRPPKPMARPKLASLINFLLRGRSPKSFPAIEKPPEPAIAVKDFDVRNRRMGHCSIREVNTEVVPSFSCWDRRCDVESDVDGLSLHNGYYASDVEASDEASDVDSIDYDSINFDMDSDLSRRTSSETVPHHGFNPTFYGDYVSEEEDNIPFNRIQMKRLHSTIDREQALKSQSAIGTPHLLSNPAYGIESKEASEESEDCKTETKLKTLKSVVKSGCRVLPASTALVDSQYIGHTSLNHLYGDVTSSDSDDGEFPEGPFDRPFEQSMDDDVTLDPRMTTSARSLPLLSFRGLTDKDHSQNMGTLTWRNMAYSPRDGSDPEDGLSRTVTDIHIRWKQNLTVESDPEICSIEDATNEAGTSDGLGITQVVVTPMRSISHDAFEDIDFKRQSIHTPSVSQIPHSQTKSRSSSPSKNSNFLITGIKQTRLALRSLTLLLDRVDVFAADKKK